jgi:RNA polymerase sigma-70 factor (ECF subfamily)
MHTTSLPLLGRLQVRTDHVSWSEFVDLYAPVLYRWNLAAGMQPADAQEVVQEVLLFIHERLETFERRRQGAFRAWLRQITLNKTREFRRRRAIDGRVGVTDELDSHVDPSAEAAWASRYAEDLFHRACDMVRDEVEEKTWKMFMRVYVERQPPDAVAAEFRVSRNMVSVAQCRCLARVRRIIDRYLEEAP